MKAFLKVKIKSLWAEAKIIQDEEFKAIDQDNEEGDLIFRELYGHRKGIVAQEQRATMIAYAFLRNRRLIDVEMKPNTIPVAILRKVDRMVNKYGVRYFESKEKLNIAFFAWLSEGSMAGNFFGEDHISLFSTIREFMQEKQKNSRIVANKP